MILSTGSPTLAPGGGALLVSLTIALYLLAALPVVALRRFSAAALLGAWILQAVLLVIDIGGVGQTQPGARLGFAPVLSLTVWLVIGVYSVESRLVPLPGVRKWLGLAGLLVVAVCAAFPGEMRPITSRLAPLHFALGVGSYALFGAAVLHALLLDAAERRLRAGGPGPPRGQTLGLPLLQLERLTFRFVEAGFVVLSGAIVLGLMTTTEWRLWGDHEAVFSVFAWFDFATLLVGRRLRGWRGRRATGWLYAGTVLLLLAYAGSRFVLEVVHGRPPT
jgi:ABC-type uncharacterized transport system permease subunit